MARTHEWHTVTIAGTGTTFPAAFDLLAGSTLATAGATVRRCLGTLSGSVFKLLAHRRPGVRLGVLVAAAADGSEIDDANLNLHDWLYLTQRDLDPISATTGQRVWTATEGPSGSWDTAVNRKLEAGQTLWLVFDWRFEDESLGNSWDVLARTLVLTPA